MEKILTITVPSFNVEKFLKQTLDSFVDERVLDVLEVLIVDDGSKDGTAAIGKAYEQQYPQCFRLISKENGGHGSTINRGIMEAKGRYFKVVDGDDWVDTEGLVELVERLKTCSADYVFTNYYEVNDTTGEKRIVEFPGICKEKEVSFSEIAKETRISMHALVIKTSILKEHKIRLDEHCFYVDVEYILYPVPYVETVIYYDIIVYMYRLAQVTQSVSMKGFQKHLQNHIDVIHHTIMYINDYQKQADRDQLKIDYMSNRIAEMIHTQVDIFMSYPPADKKIQKKFREFDMEIKNENQVIYERAGEYSGMLRMLRRTGFRFYSVIVKLSKMHNMRAER